MTKYAKIKNNSLEYAPRNKGSVSNWTNDEKAVLAEGYLPVKLQDIPEGKYQVGYEIVSGVIVRKLEDVPEPTKEEIQALRSEAYKTEVDPITCHIQRLGDEEQTAEVITEIANLVAERKAKVEEIKARYPYPAEPIEEIEELEE